MSAEKSNRDPYFKDKGNYDSMPAIRGSSVEKEEL